MKKSIIAFCFQCRYFRAFLVYGSCNLLLAAAAAAICAYIAPAAAGSGIPEVKAYLNGVDAYSISSAGTKIKMLESILVISSDISRTVFFTSVSMIL
jgi:chloride channel 7